TEDPFDLYGVYYDKNEKRFRRLPKSVAELLDDNVNTEYLAKCTAGGRVCFSTDAKEITLKVSYDGLCAMPHMPLTGSSGFVLLEQTDKKEMFIKSIAPSFEDKNGFERTVPLGGGKLKSYILYFPLYNGVNNLEIGIENTARIKHGKKYKHLKPILYYGSSITQGAAAIRPDTSYQAIISKWTGIDYINMGLSGHAHAENAILEYLQDIECCVFVYDYDHNAYDAEYLEKTHYTFYEKYRQANPTVPVIMLSSPNTERLAEGFERRRIIKKSYEKAISNGDKNVYYIDGYFLFGKKDRDICIVDGSHPTDLGFYKMAKAIYYKLIKIF
ncbi:MAG: hypothetical protein J6Y43_08215, partial [Clostridia bacterium]|nr:hypothetical protein [Clostridia bacterium]